MKASAGKRVLMLLENNPFRVDLRVRQEAFALAEAGYRVAVICPWDSRRRWKETVKGVQIYCYPAPPAGQGFLGYLWEYGWSFAAMLALSLFVKLVHGFDVIHAANPPDNSVFVAALYKPFGVRFIFDHHDLMPEMYLERFEKGGNPLVYKFLLWMERVSCRMADRIAATNQSYKSIVAKRHDIPAGRIAIIRNGPILSEVGRIAPDPDLRQRAGTLLGFVGVMAPQDGVDYLLRAVHQLVYELKREDVYCVIIGKGSALEELKQQAQELKLEHHVWFTGFIPEADKLRYLSTVDICLDPDPSNPFNDRCTMIKMMEYMAMGKPIVAFDLPEHRVSADDAALYARPNDELDFARQIARLADHPELREQMGRRGLERIEQQLEWKHQAQKLLALYADLFADRHAPLEENRNQPENAHVSPRDHIR